MTEYTQLKDDTIRKVEPPSRHTCDWCGQTRSNGSLFRYGGLSPMLRKDWEDTLFCSLECRNDYYS
jgi:hypothetical protein